MTAVAHITASETMREVFSTSHPSSPSALSWLRAQKEYPKWYFNDQQGEYACCGTLMAFSEPPQIAQNASHRPPLRIVGGRDFTQAPRKTSLWRDIPRSLYVVPRFEWHINAVYANDCAPHPIASPRPSCIDDPTPLPPPISCCHAPDKQQWYDAIHRAHRDFTENRLHKIVLARATTLEYEEALSPFSLLHHLKDTSAHCAIFGAIFTPQLAFVGASPEELFSCTETTLRTHAIAGTRPRGRTRKEDLSLKLELLSSEKDLSEFSFVHETIARILGQYCSEVTRSFVPKVVQTATVQHLKHTFFATRKATTQIQDLLTSLHPTPAVGGVPLAHSLQMIYDIEPFDRGWYAAPFGYISASESRMLVALRSALVRQNRLTLFAGTGIVPGSNAASEWQELNDKIKPYLCSAETLC